MFINKKRGQAFGAAVVVLLVIALVGIFLSGPGITGSVTKDTCFEGTEYGKCSFVKPKYCDNGALKPNCQKCGCPANQVCLENGECIPKCNDGTLFGRCSETQPFYCFRGNLVENCFKCGCYEGGACQADGRCTGRRIRRCDDNTVYNRCSKDKPKYCKDGELIDMCSLCGCPEGMICKDEKCLEEEQEEQEIIVKCNDGTISNECSKTKPYLCEDGLLAEACGVCGCDKGECIEDGSCSVPSIIKDIRWFLLWFCEVLRLQC